MTGLAAPLWVERLASDAWPRIVAASPKPEWVPQHTDRTRSSQGWRMHFAELGCGHYGCVMPTSDPEVVCKITSDPTEAVFIAAAMTLGEPPEGIVRYHGVYELGEAYRGRPTFVLWREAATEVGLHQAHTRSMWGTAKDPYEMRRIDKLARYLGLFKDAANAVRESLKRADRAPSYPAAVTTRLELLAEAKKYEDWAWQRSAELDLDRVIGDVISRVLGPLRGAMRLAMALRLCELIAELMQNTDGSDLLGDALGHYLDKGILLADVHGHNVGKVERTPGWVITDPGHAVGLEARWDAVTVPRLP